MKVLQLTTHLSIGGVANYVVTLAAALKKKGLECLVASSGGDMQSELLKDGIEHRGLDIRTKFELHPKVFASAFDLSKVVRRERIDIIHAHTRVSQVAAACIASLTGVPYITTCHGFFEKRFRGVLDTWGARVIAISDAVKEHLMRDLGLSEGRIALVYTGIDAARFSRDYSPGDIVRIRRSVGLQDEAPLIGTIGRLSSVKGHKYFIQAMEHVLLKRPQAQALIVGDGPEEESLKELGRSLILKGALLFHPSDIDTAGYLAAMDIFVFPSVKEGLGLAILEALAAGKACVASDIGGISDIIKDGVEGLLAPVGDPMRIAEAILKLLEDERSRRSMGERGRALVRERFTLDSMAQNVIGVYEDVLKGRGAKRKGRSG